MKAFTFINSYICGIQVGIQAGHAIVNLMNRHREYEDECPLYPGSGRRFEMVKEWAANHKTFVWLDGGSDTDLDSLTRVLFESGMPYSYFREDGLDGALTAATVILSDELVHLCDLVRAAGGVHKVDVQEVEFTKIISNGSEILGELDQDEWALCEVIINARTKSL